MQQQQVLLGEAQQKLEKSKLLPAFSAGFSSSTIIGWQTRPDHSEKYFGGGKRFSALSLGIGVPLFSSAGRARIQAARVLTRQKQQELDATRQQLQANLEEALLVYHRHSALVQSYQSTLLPNATTILKTATAKLSAGEIGYLDWVMLVNQALQTQGEYFNAVQQLNEAAIEIEKISAIN